LATQLAPVQKESMTTRASLVFVLLCLVALAAAGMWAYLFVEGLNVAAADTGM
jgi:hypothetical protein